MEQHKLLRVLWTINGILFLITFLYIGYDKVTNWLASDEYETPELIVGEKLEEAKKKGLALQGLEYDSPIKILGSPTYVLPISVKTYEVPRKQADMAKFNGDIYIDPSVFSNQVNIVFLNQSFEVTKVLLDRKGFIESFTYPEEYNSFRNTYGQQSFAAPYLTYTIGFVDSNGDGLLNIDDATDLYLSELDGSNFRQVTSNVSVQQALFIKPNELLVEYVKRDTVREEYKLKRFAIYRVKERRLEDLGGLHLKIDSLEKVLTQ